MSTVSTMCFFEHYLSTYKFVSHINAAMKNWPWKLLSCLREIAGTSLVTCHVINKVTQHRYPIGTTEWTVAAHPKFSLSLSLSLSLLQDPSSLSLSLPPSLPLSPPLSLIPSLPPLSLYRSLSLIISLFSLFLHVRVYHRRSGSKREAFGCVRPKCARGSRDHRWTWSISWLSVRVASMQTELLSDRLSNVVVG